MKRAALALGVLALLATAFLGFIGYFGGPVFTPVVPDARHAAASATIAVFSGDMGFRMGLAPKVAVRLAGAGLPVLGINSLTYFRVRRTPEEVGQLITTAIDRARRASPRGRVVLVGMSFGSDMLVAGLPRLPIGVRREVAAVILVVPGETIQYRASPAEMLGLGQPEEPALSLARQIDWVPVTCIHGALERNSLCPLWRAPNVRQVTLPGGHHLDNDPDRLSAVVLDAVRRHAA